MSDPNPEDQASQVKQALFGGNKIQAIKFYREQTGVGLKEAKDAVEKFEAELRVASPEQFTKSPTSGGCARVVLTLIVIVVWVLCVR